MNKHAFRAAAVAAVSFGWIAIAGAQLPQGAPRRGPGGPGFGPGGPGPEGAPIERITEHLGLSDEQREQWKALHEKARETGKPLMEAAHQAREAFEAALDAENAEPANVGRAALAMRAAGRKVEEHRKATFDAAKAILTPEQLAKLEEGGKRRLGPGEGAGFGPGRPRRPGHPAGGGAK
jgi:periplasmic protein CpxP/Spy